MDNRRLTALDILRRLPKTNCRECGTNTCLAFATKVIGDRKPLTDCPYLDRSAVADLSAGIKIAQSPPESDPERALLEVKRKVRELDFAEAAARLGLKMVGDRLRVHVLGRIFDVDPNGDLHTIGHINHWLHGPLLHYILHSEGRDIVGEWIPYSDLAGVEETAPFFAYRCEKDFGRLFDEHAELVTGILSTFGKPAANGLVDADVSIQLMPLPRVPFLYSYWKPEGEFPSRFSIHFDRSVEVNLDPRSILFLAAGIADMFTRFVATHAG